jgi:CrcB protein
MGTLAAIALGGALGALARYGVGRGVHAVVGAGFPYGTLLVNVAGCLAIGYLYVELTERSIAAPEVRALLMTGFLGAFTTFSAFSMETLLLAEQGAMLKAAANVGLNVALCLTAAWLGIVFGRAL